LGGRLMLCNIGRIGDTIMRNAILDAAFRSYATVDYLCGLANADIVRADSRMNQVMVFSNSLAGLVGLLKAILGRRYDGLIDLKDHASSTSIVMARLFRSRVKTGYNRNRFGPFHRDVRNVINTNDHMVETMRRIGQLAGLQAADYNPSLVVPRDSIQWFRQNYRWNRPFIFLNLSATHFARFWPVKNWAQYVRGCGLADQPILINGLPTDRENVSQLCGELPGAVPFQARNFLDVAAAVADARMVLTVDTGVVHACSVLDKPIVAFYCKDSSGIRHGPLSTRRLVIQPQHGRFLSGLDPEYAIAETLRHGLT
jgi:ADP-heptose:LPS heptosyltransferase